MPDDGLEVEENEDSTWHWTWQSPGGAYWRSPQSYESKAVAMKNGRAWLKKK